LALGEVLFEEGLVRGGGFESLLVHEVVEGTADLVAALADLNKGHCHYK
jgi:hypothetical protein